MALELYHATVYFEPRAKDIYSAAGLKGYWMGYFASRAAALGAVGPEVVIATFFNFEPGKVRRAIPDAWTFATPQGVLAARLEVADTALSKLSLDTSEAADLAVAITQAIDVAGRPLAAAHLATHVPGVAHLRLWWAATVLREHRGDGHVALLVAEGIDGCEAHVLKHAAGEGPGPEQMLLSRGWTAEQWEAARARLESRGLMSGSVLSDSGSALRDRLEERTDDLAWGPYEAAPSGAVERLLELMEPIGRQILGLGEIPFPNPIGLPRPT